MKKLTVMFFALILLCSAQVSEGKTIERKARKYHEFFDEAIANPGMPVLVRQFKELKLKSMFKEVIKIREGFIVYNEAENRIFYLETRREKDERESLLIIVSLLSLIFIIVLNIEIKRGYNLPFGLRFFLIFVVVGLFVLAALTINAFVFLAFALASFLSFVAVRNGDTKIENKKEILGIMIVVTYLSVALHFVFLFVLG